jgi:xylose dehydrogenase (NAD/NADP)
MPDKIRWGILSTANINDALITPIRKSARSELVAVGSRDAAKAQEYAQRKEIPRSHGSYEALLDDPDIDAVYISLPNSLHCEWTVKAAEAGKHVLCEKPLVISLSELNLVEAAARRNGVVVFEAFMYLHHPQTLKAQQLIAQGALGELQTIQSWFHFFLSPERGLNNIRLRPDVSGGSLWDVGVYPNSLAITMAGRPPLSVVGDQIIGPTGVDITMRGQLRFSDGLAAQISSGFKTAFREGAHIVGSEGTLYIAEPWKPGLFGKESVMTLTRLDRSVEEIVTPPIDPYLCEVQAMEACVLDGASPVVSLAQSRDFLRSVLALYESAKSGQVVAL